MGEKYRICVVANKNTLEFIENPKIKEDVTAFVYRQAQEVLESETAISPESGEVSFISEEDDTPSLREYDMILHINGAPSDLEYMTRMVDPTYDEEWVTAKSGDGKTFRMPFGAFKGYLRQSCGIAAGLSRALNAASRLHGIYTGTLFGDGGGSFEEDSDSAYAQAERAINEAEGKLNAAYADAWKKMMIQFENLLRLEPKYQFNLLGKYLHLREEKIERMKLAQSIICCSSEGENDEGKDYDFVMDALVTIYEENEVL